MDNITNKSLQYSTIYNKNVGLLGFMMLVHPKLRTPTLTSKGSRLQPPSRKCHGKCTPFPCTSNTVRHRCLNPRGDGREEVMGRLYADYACLLVSLSPRVRKTPPISVQPGAQNTFIFLSFNTQNNSCKITK